VREAIPFVLLACACGAATWKGPADPKAGAQGDPRSRPGASDAARMDPRFSALEVRAASVAPGMRAIAERESAGERIELVRAAGRDMCVRVVFEATTAVVGKLVDGEGSTLAQSPAATTQGTLGEQGPVCVRKGDAVNALADGAGGARVRWVAWAAP
jgi:hypothetical protein